MKKGTRPGTDRINVEIYIIFWDDIKMDLLSALNFSFREGNLIRTSEPKFNNPAT